MTRTPSHLFHLPSPGADIDGRYKVVDQIGEGSYGWVFAVEHLLLGQTFAMKILHPRVASEPSWIARFREEAKSTALIGHENIVFVTDFGKCPDYGSYFIMEYLDGCTLEEVLAGGESLGVQRSVNIALQAAGALSAAHDQGIVHRDLKPGNIMLVERSDGSEACKLLDFGISSIVMAAAKTNKLYGTPAYMAPEQAIQPDVDGRADQFSLATIVYKMLTGRAPWKTNGWEDATPAGRTQPPPAPSNFVEGVSGELDKVVLRALSVPFEHRFANIDDFASALVASSSVDWIPKSDPYDPYLSPETQAEHVPQVTVANRGAGESMVIVVDDGDDGAQVRPLFTVRFRTAERLLREYRRNMLAGGLFLPTEERPALHSDIKLQLVFEPMMRSIELDAEVVAHAPADAGSPGGFGVAIPDAARDRLTTFLRRLEVGLELSGADMLHPLNVPMTREELSAAEAFLFSRLDEPMSVAAIRAFSSGLPFEVELALQSLIGKGLLEVEPADLSSLSETSSIHDGEPDDEQDRDAEPPPTLGDDDTRFPWTDVTELGEVPSEISYSRREVERVLSRVRYFKARQNYMGAFQVLRRALDVSPSVAEFYHQLALLHAEFRGDYPRAFQALHGAIQLDPANQAYARTRAKLEKLAGLDD